MPDSSAEVRIKLVVDDQSQATLNRLQEGLKGAHEETGKSAKEAHGLGHELLRANLAAELIKKSAELGVEALKESAEAAYEFAKSAAETADEVNGIERGMAGLMTFMDQGQHSFQDLKEYAGGLREELEKSGTAAGVSSKQMSDVFDQVIERGTVGTDRAAELTEQMALVGKITRGGMEGLSQGFAMVEMGAIRARNPLVQLIASTHTLKGNAHAVAAQLQKMTPSAAMELAQKAIAKQAEMMKAGGGFITPTLGELGASFGNIREAFMNAVGQPMLDHLIPPLAKIRDYLSDHMGEIEDFATKIGVWFGSVIDTVSAAGSGIYDAVKENWGEIRGIYDQIETAWRTVWGYSNDTATVIHAKFKSMAETIIGAFKEVMRYVQAAAEVFNNIADAFKHPLSMPGQTNASNALAGAMQQTMAIGGGTEGQKAMDEAVARYRMFAKEALTPPAEIEANSEMLRRTFDQLSQAADQAAGTVKAQSWEQFSTYLNSAVDVANKTGSDTQEKYALGLIAQSEQAQRALLNGGIVIAGGMEDFMKMIAEKSPELARKLKEMHDPIKREGGITPKGAYNDFRGSTFNLKQDFRDQDPGRVAMLFRRDVLKAAQARGQSKLATPFGL